MDSLEIGQCLHTILGHIGRTSKLYDYVISIAVLALLTCLLSGGGPSRYQDLSFEKDKADGMPHVAAKHIMDDDLESAEAGLANGNSSFHKVCQYSLSAA